MGLVNAKIILKNPRVKKLKPLEADALVDLGAVHLCISEHIHVLSKICSVFLYNPLYFQRFLGNLLPSPYFSIFLSNKNTLSSSIVDSVNNFFLLIKSLSCKIKLFHVYKKPTKGVVYYEKSRPFYCLDLFKIYPL